MTRTTMMTTTQKRTKASVYISPFLYLKTCFQSPAQQQLNQHGPCRTCFNPSHVSVLHQFSENPWKTTLYHHVCCLQLPGRASLCFYVQYFKSYICKDGPKVSRFCLEDLADLAFELWPNFFVWQAFQIYDWTVYFLEEAFFRKDDENLAQD